MIELSDFLFVCLQTGRLAQLMPYLSSLFPESNKHILLFSICTKVTNSGPNWKTYRPPTFYKWFSMIYKALVYSTGWVSLLCFKEILRRAIEEVRHSNKMWLLIKQKQSPWRETQSQRLIPSAYNPKTKHLHHSPG